MAISLATLLAFLVSFYDVHLTYYTSYYQMLSRWTKITFDRFFLRWPPRPMMFLYLPGLIASCYTFVVGKINPAKLSNFAEIECFVMVACPEHSLLQMEGLGNRMACILRQKGYLVLDSFKYFFVVLPCLSCSTWTWVLGQALFVRFAMATDCVSVLSVASNELVYLAIIFIDFITSSFVRFFV